MPTTLSYGTNEKCSLENIEAIHLRPCDSQPLGEAQIAGQVVSQLANPLNYPALSQAMIPGDEVVVAVEPETPQLLHVLDGVLQSLSDAGAERQQISVLLPASFSQAESLRSSLGKLGHQGFNISVHDPDNEKGMAFLGVSEAGLAIRLNCLLCDADFVLPVGVTHCPLSVSEGTSSHTMLYPAFSERETIDRIANENAMQFPASNLTTQREIEECSRQLGAQLQLQIIPHTNGGVAEIMAGESNSLLRQAESVYRERWRAEATARSSLVVATITGDSEQQTWTSLGRAVAAAESLLEAEGSLVVYSELTDLPGQAIGLLAGNEDPLVVEREIQKTQAADCGPAMALNRALERGPVYLRSKLRPAVVESLGMTPLESDSELERLAQTLGSCVVLEEAQHTLPLLLDAAEELDG